MPEHNNYSMSYFEESHGGAAGKSKPISENRCLHKRYPLTNERKIHTFLNDTEGFYPYKNTKSADFVTRIHNSPFTMYGEGGCVHCECEKTRADAVRSIRKDYEAPLDLSDSTCVTVACDCTRFAPGDQYYGVFTLYSGEESYECTAKILSECWNTTIFTVGGCEFLNSITSVEFGVCNDSAEDWGGCYQLGGIFAGEVCDFAFEVEGAYKAFSAENGEISFDGGLKFDFSRGGALTSPYFPDAHNTKYNAPLDLRNTLFFVMKNDSPAAKVRVSFLTDSQPEYSSERSKVFDIEPNSDFKAYFFNFSDLPTARGRLAGFRVEPLDAEGNLTVWRVTPEEEEPIYDYAGCVEYCAAKGGAVGFRLDIKNTRGFEKLAVYETAMYNVFDEIKGLTKLFEAPAAAGEISGAFPLMRGNVSRLSSQFLAVLENPDGEFIKVAPRFFVENYRDYSYNPYAFGLPYCKVDARDFGAVADAFTDDTRAIQAAIDEVNRRGGGTVNLPYFNTGRYIITNLMLKSNVELHMEDGVVLWQSQTDSDYQYPVFYGHDVPMRDINWTHALHVATYPLIQAKYCKNVKITGHGKIRSMDTGSEERRISWYPNNCQDRIHCITIGFFSVENVEFRDFEVVRANNYHMSLYASENIYIANLKMHEVKCVSGDGIGFNCGSNHIKIERCFYESNDDGVVITASYNDPRGLRWWWGTPGMHNGLHDIEVKSSYFNSGGGKAIAFITWGTDDPVLENEEIENIYVHDCVLKGGYSVGTWPDNPYNGKVPFDNMETDDWSPVKNVRIFNNDYLSPTDLLCIKPTNFLTDCSIRSASEFQNADFSLGKCFWSVEGDVTVKDGFAAAGAGRIYQGLFLQSGEYELTLTLCGRGRIFAEDALNGRVIAEDEFALTEKTDVTLRFTLEEENTLALGVYSGFVYNAKMEKIQ